MSRASILLTVRRQCRLEQSNPRIVARHSSAHEHRCSTMLLARSRSLLLRSTRTGSSSVVGRGAFAAAFESLKHNNSNIVAQDRLRWTTRTVQRRHSLSSSAAVPTASGSSNKSSDSKSSDSKSKSSSNTGNVFLDYAGSIFLSAIGVIVVWLVRSYQNTQRRNMCRDAIEDAAHLDPLEMDDLRTANSDTVTVEQFTNVLQELFRNDSNNNELTYPQFVQRVRSILMKVNDNNPAFTVQLGHLLDRVALAALEKHDKTLDDTMPVTFWLTLFSLALSGSATDRIRVLYRMMQLQLQQQRAANRQPTKEGGELQADFTVSDSNDDNDNDNTKVTIDQVVELVAYLQDTYQLVPDSQVVPTARQYPLQEYAVGTPEQLVDRHRWIHHEALTPTIDYAAVASILRSKSVCAWGECYHKKTF